MTWKQFCLALRLLVDLLGHVFIITMYIVLWYWLLTHSVKVDFIWKWMWN